MFQMNLIILNLLPEYFNLNTAFHNQKLHTASPFDYLPEKTQYVLITVVMSIVISFIYKFLVMIMGSFMEYAI